MMRDVAWPSADLLSCLDLFPVLAFVTDPCNRIVRVNRAFARTVGDPVADRLPAPARFVPAAIAGPYRDRFPRWKEEISHCLASLYLQVEAGNLAPETMGLIEGTLELWPDELHQLDGGAHGVDGEPLLD